jgi:hypothetical protein
MIQNVSPATPNVVNQDTNEVTYGVGCTMLLGNVPDCEVAAITVAKDDVTEVNVSTNSSTPADFTISAATNAAEYPVSSQLSLTAPSSAGMTELSTSALKVVSTTTASGVTTLQLAEPVASKNITGVTKGTTTTLGVTSHGLSAGSFVLVSGFKGEWDFLNSATAYKIGASPTTDAFVIETAASADVDTSNLSAYDSSVHGVGKLHAQTATVASSNWSATDAIELTTSGVHGLVSGQTVTFANMNNYDALNGFLFEVVTVSSTNLYLRYPGSTLNIAVATLANSGITTAFGGGGALIPVGFEGVGMATNTFTAHSSSDPPIKIMSRLPISAFAVTNDRVVLTIPGADSSLQPGDLVEVQDIAVGATEMNGVTYVVDTVIAHQITLLTKSGTFYSTTYTPTTSSATSFFGPQAAVVQVSGSNVIHAESLNLTFITETIESTELSAGKRGKPLLKSFPIGDFAEQVVEDYGAFPYFFGTSIKSGTSAGYRKHLFPLSRLDLDILYGSDNASLLMGGTLFGPYGNYETREAATIATDLQVVGSLAWGNKDTITFKISESTLDLTNNNVNKTNSDNLLSDVVDTFYGSATAGDHTQVVSLDPTSSTMVAIGRKQMKVIAPFTYAFEKNPALLPQTFLVGDDGLIIGRSTLAAFWEEILTTAISKADGTTAEAAIVDVVLGTGGAITKSSIQAEITEKISSAANKWLIETNVQIVIGGGSNSLTNDADHEVYLSPRNKQEEGSFESVTTSGGTTYQKFVKTLKLWSGPFSNSSVIKPSAEKIQAPDSLLVLNNYQQANTGPVVDADEKKYAIFPQSPVTVNYPNCAVTKSMLYAGLSSDPLQRGAYTNLFTGWYDSYAAASAAGALPEGHAIGQNSLKVSLKVTLTDSTGNPVPAAGTTPNTFVGQMQDIPTTDLGGGAIYTGWSKILSASGQVTGISKGYWPFHAQNTTELVAGTTLTDGGGSYLVTVTDASPAVDLSLTPTISNLSVAIPATALEVYGVDNEVVYATAMVQVGSNNRQSGANSAPVQLTYYTQPTLEQPQLGPITNAGTQTWSVMVSAPDFAQTPATLSYIYGDSTVSLGQVTAPSQEFSITLSSSIVEAVSNSIGSKKLSINLNVTDSTSATWADLVDAVPPVGQTSATIVTSNTVRDVDTVFIKSPNVGTSEFIAPYNATVDGINYIIDSTQPVMGYLVVQSAPVVTQQILSINLANIETIAYSDAVLEQIPNFSLAVQPGNTDDRRGQSTTLEMSQLEDAATSFQAALATAQVGDSNLTSESFVSSIKAAIASGSTAPSYLIPIPNMDLQGKAGRFEQWMLMRVASGLSENLAHYTQAVESLLGTSRSQSGFQEGGQYDVQQFVGGTSWTEMTSSQYGTMIQLTNSPTIKDVAVNDLTLKVTMDYGMMQPSSAELNGSWSTEALALVRRSGNTEFSRATVSGASLINAFSLSNANTGSVNQIQVRAGSPVNTWDAYRESEITLTFAGNPMNGDAILNSAAQNGATTNIMDVIFNADASVASGSPTTAIFSFDDTAMQEPMMLVAQKNMFINEFLPLFDAARSAKIASDGLAASLSAAIIALQVAEAAVQEIQNSDPNYLSLVDSQATETEVRSLYLANRLQLQSETTHFLSPININAMDSHHGNAVAQWDANAFMVNAAFMALAAEPGANLGPYGYAEPAAGGAARTIAQNYIDTAVNGFYPVSTNLNALNLELITAGVGLAYDVTATASALATAVQAYENDASEANAAILIAANLAHIEAEASLESATQKFEAAIAAAETERVHLAQLQVNFAALETQYNDSVRNTALAAANLGGALNTANQLASAALTGVYGVGGTADLATSDSLQTQASVAETASTAADAALLEAETNAEIATSTKWLALKTHINDNLVTEDVSVLQNYVIASVDAEILSAATGASEMVVSYILVAAPAELQQV